MKKIAALILIIVLCTSLLACGKRLQDGIVVQYGDTGIDEKYFISSMTGYKNSTLYYFGLDGDSTTMWDMTLDDETGHTFSDEIKKLALEECASVVWVIDWGKKNGVSLNEDDIKLVESDIAVLKEELGSEEKYLEYITSFGCENHEDMQKYCETNRLYQKSMDALTAKGAPYEITDADIDKYFEENYIAVKHIYVNTVAELDESGKNYVAISEEKLTAQNERVELYEEGLLEGDYFDLLYSLSDDGMQAEHLNGMTITRGDVPSTEYEEVCFSLEIGEWKKVEIENQGVYFIKRVEIPEEGYERKSEVKSLIQGDIQTKIYNEYKKDFTVNEEFINSVDVKALSVLQ